MTLKVSKDRKTQHNKHNILRIPGTNERWKSLKRVSHRKWCIKRCNILTQSLEPYIYTFQYFVHTFALRVQCEQGIEIYKILIFASMRLSHYRRISFCGKRAWYG